MFSGKLIVMLFCSQKLPIHQSFDAIERSRMSCVPCFPLSYRLLMPFFSCSDPRLVFLPRGLMPYVKIHQHRAVPVEQLILLSETLVNPV